MKPSGYISETEYQDPTLHVTIETGRKDECDFWAARVKIGHPSQLRTAAAAGFENDYTAKGVYIARRQNAVLAINGDYYSYYQYGYILRQGKEFRNKLRAERDVLAIDENGDFHILYTPDRNSMTPTLDGKKLINVFHFGPALVADGEIGTLEASYWLAPESKRQRMCIAKHSPSSPCPWKTKCSLAGSTPCLCWNALLRFCVPQQFCSRPCSSSFVKGVFLKLNCNTRR